MQQNVSEVYDWVVDDVIGQIRGVFQQEGLALSILDELRTSWSRRLKETDQETPTHDEVDLTSQELRGSTPRPMPTAPATAQRVYPIPHLAGNNQDYFTGYHQPLRQHHPLGMRALPRRVSMTQPGFHQMIGQSGLPAGIQGFQLGGGGGRGHQLHGNGRGHQLHGNGIRHGAGMFNSGVFNGMLQQRSPPIGSVRFANSNEFHFHRNPAVIASPDPPVYRFSGKRKGMEELTPPLPDLSNKTPRLTRGIPQRDGQDDGPEPGPSSLEDKDLDDEDGLSEEEEEPANYANWLVAQYEKVSRTKNRWRCTLKHGIFSVDGKDYLFKTANGEFTF